MPVLCLSACMSGNNTEPLSMQSCGSRCPLLMIMRAALCGFEAATWAYFAQACSDMHPVPSDNGIRHGGTFTVNSAEYSPIVIGSSDERLFTTPSSQHSNENRWLFSAQWFHSFASVYILITIQLHAGTEKRIDWSYQSHKARERKMKSIRLL